MNYPRSMSSSSGYGRLSTSATNQRRGLGRRAPAHQPPPPVSELEAFGFKGGGAGGGGGGGGAGGSRGGSGGTIGRVANLDVFFGSAYRFFQCRGLPTIVAEAVTNALTLAFTVVFSTFLFSYVDWARLGKCRDEESCEDHLSAYIRDPWRHVTFVDVMVLFW